MKWPSGTKLAISEYDWGANESMNSALAQADVLGIFGREGLDIATNWGSYASKQGYDILSDIKPGDGYWVNAKTTSSALFQLGAPFKLTATNLATGWGLFANGTSLNPSAFNVGLSAVSPVPGTIPQIFISLWAWDNASSKWYFFAPSLQVQGGNVLADYVNAKGYLDFTSVNKSIEPGVGFWVCK